MSTSTQPLSPATQTLYTASAGSGKTFQLVYQFLHGCFTAQEKGESLPFRSLLAITFTNKAAAEMKHRIIRALSTFAGMIPESSAAKADLGIRELLMQAFPSWSIEKLSVQSEQLLHRILHNYGLFSVSTIDQFTHRIIRSFAADLNLRPDFDVEMNMDLLYAETVKRILSDVGQSDEKLNKILLEVQNTNLEENNSDNLEFGLLDRAKEVLQDTLLHVYRELSTVPNEAWDRAVEQYWERQKAHLAKGKELYEELLAMLPEGFVLKDFMPGFAGKVEALKAGDLKDSNTYGPNVEKVINGQPFAKTKQKRADALGWDAVAFENWCERWVDYNTASARLDALGRIMNSLPFARFGAGLAKAYDEVVSELNVVGISEFNRIVHQELEQAPEAFIYERIGERYRTYFIDEFQDTSLLQWQNLTPLVENALASGGRAMLVGDAKQSIYAFRGANVYNFMSVIEKEGETGIEVRKLEYNYRSTPRIVEFNNALLQQMSERFQTPILKKLYESGAQSLPENASDGPEGYVRAVFCEKDDTGEGKEYVKAVRDSVADVLERGHQPADIAILCRNSKEGVVIAEALLADPELVQAGVSVMSEDALSMLQNPQVRLLMATLAYMENPADPYAQGHWLHRLSELGYLQSDALEGEGENVGTRVDAPIHAQKTTPDGSQTAALWQAIANRNFEDRMAQTGYGIPAEWQALPITEQLDLLIGLYGLHDCPFSLALLNRAFEYLASKHRWEHRFTEYVRTFGQKWTAQAGQSANSLYIGTIHKSKGLEFPVVLLPLAGWDLVHAKESTWLPNHLKDAFEGIPYLKIPINALDNLSEYSNERAEWHEQNCMNQGNLLYVACTRAEEELHIILPPEPKQSEKQRMNTWMHADLKALFGWEDGIQHTGTPEVKTPGWKDSKNEPANAERAKNTPVPPSKLTHWAERLRIAQQRRKSWDEVADTARDFGVLMHRLLAEIDRVGDEDAWITNALASGEISAETADLLRKRMEGIWDHPQLKAWFSTDAPVYAEREIALPNGTFYRPDRVIMSHPPVVIDFKTGAEHAEHHEQVAGYLRLLAGISGEEPAGALVYLNANELVVKNVKFATLK